MRRVMISKDCGKICWRLIRSVFAVRYLCRSAVLRVKNGTKNKRTLCMTLRLGHKELYGKAVKELAHDPKIHPGLPGTLDKMRALHPDPAQEVVPIREGALPLGGSRSPVSSLEV